METNKKVTIVGEEYRTNSLSLTKGGSTVEVHYETRVKVYNNIKNVTSYIRAIKLKNDVNSEKIIATYVDGKKTKHNWETLHKN